MRLIVSILLTLAFVGCGSTGKTPPKTTGTNSRRDIPAEPDPRANAQRNDGGSDASRLITAYFDYDDSALRMDAKGALKQNAEVLKSRSNVRVELQGNCDERGTDEYNLMLGKKRAEAAKRYLSDLGIPENRMSTVSFGEENPAVQGEGEPAFAKNRRVDFVLR